MSFWIHPKPQQIWCFAEGQSIHQGHKQVDFGLSGDGLHGESLPQKCEKQHWVSDMAAIARITQSIGQPNTQLQVGIQREFFLESLYLRLHCLPVEYPLSSLPEKVAHGQDVEKYAHHANLNSKDKKLWCICVLLYFKSVFWGKRRLGPWIS